MLRIWVEIFSVVDFFRVVIQATALDEEWAEQSRFREVKTEMSAGFLFVWPTRRRVPSVGNKFK